MPDTAINRPDLGNKSFPHAVLAAIIFMILSAAILVSGFLAWHYPQLTAGSNIKPITLTGNDLYIAIGKGEKQDNKLIVKELIEDGTAVISSRRTRFNASNFPILEYKIAGRNPGTDVVLYWRTITHNHQTLFAKLHWNSDYKTAYNLQSHPTWKGKITELGISIAGDLRNEPISIEQLTFSPLTVKSLLLTVWSEWNKFQGWTHSSINVITGMPPNALVSPVVAVAAWCGLAMLMYSLNIVRTSVTRRDTLFSVDRDHPDNSVWKVTKKIWDFRAVVAMFLIAWLALDSKWQVNLWRQLADTKYLFAGKTHNEQHMAADDAELYAYAKRLKNEVLPKEPVRIFILHNEWKSYTRLKLLYYLLPHNIYAFFASPPNYLLRNNDYILAANPIEDLTFLISDKRLQYGKGLSMQASLLDETTTGTLFQVYSSNVLLNSLTVDHYWQSNVLSGRILDNTVIIAGVPTYNSPDPGIVGLGVDSIGRWRIRFQEWDYQNDSHSQEHVGILALKPGAHHMPDGSIWEAGKIQLKNSERQSIHFGSDFPAPPKVFLMPQHSAKHTAINLRATNITHTSLEIMAKTQESKQDQIPPVTVGYLAVYSPDNQGNIIIENKNVPYHLTQAHISSEWRSLGSYEIFLQEEQSLDEEIIHAPELVHIMELGGQVYAQVVSTNEPDTVGIRMRWYQDTK